jgi:SAM-dependent methyltransferase
MHTDEQIQAGLQKYPWYHNIRLTETISTPGWTNPGVLQTQEAVLRALRSLDVTGKRVLDIGCRDGLFSFAAEKQGAGEVIGIDNDLSLGATEFLIPFFRSNVRMDKLNVYDLIPERFGTFDVVVFPGVLYHLRYPFWGLRQARNALVPGGYLILETAIWVDENRYPLLFCPVGAESPYEPTSCTFFNMKGMTDTLESLGLTVRATDRVFRCPPPEPPAPSLVQRLKAVVRPAEPAPAPPPAVDRCVFVCQRGEADAAVATRTVQEYWEGTHEIHTVREGDWSDQKPAA